MLSTYKHTILKIFFITLILSVSVTVYAQQKKINVYVMLAEECPISQSMGPALAALGERYDSAVNFLAVFPVKTSTTKTAASFQEIYKLSMYQLIVDKRQALAKKLHATVTPEAIITNADGTILYRGRINDSFSQPGKKNNRSLNNDAATAIERAISNQLVLQPWPAAIGCLITYSKK